jgi:putative ABC transport system permease protein
MLAYYLRLGLRSLRRNPVLTGLMIMAIGFGVAASMTTFAVFRAVSGNPIPWKSSQLFVPQIDGFGPSGRDADDHGEPPEALNYLDTMALMRAHPASRQTALYPVAISVVPADAAKQPFSISGYAVTTDFFSMFEMPFQYGSGWGTNEDDKRASTVVISSKLNQKVFDGANSVGRNIVLDNRDYRIVGVAKNWDPHPRYYDVVNTSGFGDAPDFFMPFSRAIDLQLDTDGNNNCNKSPGGGWDAWLQSTCVWLTVWAELPDAAAVQRYRSYLDGYAADQKRAGRYNWAPNNRLRNVMEWLDHEHVVPQETKVSLLVALGFLAVCLVNTIGLLLAKFMRRSQEIGVRRALGASRREIYTQFLAEASMVGVAGGVLGLLLTAGGVYGIGMVFEPEIAELAHVDFGLIGLTLLVAIAATVIAAFYPTWRAAQVQPAWQLKSN